MRGSAHASSGQAATYTIAAREAWGRIGSPGPLQGRLNIPSNFAFEIAETYLAGLGHTMAFCVHGCEWRNTFPSFEEDILSLTLFPTSCTGSKSAAKPDIKTVDWPP